MAKLDLTNRTHLDTTQLEHWFAGSLQGWSVGTVHVRVRYSRGADFSGSCYYGQNLFYLNLGQHLRYPYAMGTHLAKARSHGRSWSKPVYTVELAEAFEVVYFVFLHELYHLLLKRAKRNLRQKESMCDRFAARVLVERFGAVVRDPKGQLVPREAWDFQDLDGFVAAARDRRLTVAGSVKAHRPRPTEPVAASRPIRELDAPAPVPPADPPELADAPAPTDRQLMLFRV